MKLRKLVLFALASSTLILTVGTVHAGPGKKKRANNSMMNMSTDAMPTVQSMPTTQTMSTGAMQSGTMPTPTSAPVANQMNTTPAATTTQMMPGMQAGQTNNMPYNTNSKRGNRGRRGMSNNSRRQMSPMQPTQSMQPGGMLPAVAGVQPAMGMIPVANAAGTVTPANNVAPTTGGDVQTRTANYLSPTDPRAVRLKVTLPTADTKLFIQGQPMTPTGTKRNFVSPPLELGRQYISTIRAVWMQAGAERVFERQVNVIPGQETTLRIE